MNTLTARDAAIPQTYEDHALHLPEIEDGGAHAVGVGFPDLGDLGDGGDGSVGAFLRLHLDPTLLATFESPSFDETSAVPLDALSATQSSAFQPSKRAKTMRKQSVKGNTVPTVSTAIESADSDATEVDASIGLMLSSLRTPTGDMRCRYRRNKCSSARTLKKNGSLHSYCEVHRQRSIVNQRRFDSKKREAREQQPCQCASVVCESTTMSLTLQVEPNCGPSDDASLSEELTDRPASQDTLHVIESGFAWV